jgi:hypothetical protein
MHANLCCDTFEKSWESANNNSDWFIDRTFILAHSKA